MKKKPKNSCSVFWRISTLIIAAFCALLPSGVIAAPSISGFGGTVSNGQAVTITGSGFGSTGPTIVVFDDFEKGSSGSLVSTSGGTAQVNQWSGIVGNVKYSSAVSHSLSKSATVDFNRMGSGATPQLLLNYPSSTEVYLSVWLYLPSGKDVPGTNNPDGPNWKLFWLWSDPWPGSDYLPVFLSNAYPFAAAFGAGDDQNSPARFSGNWFNTTFMKSDWKRFDMYMKGGQTDGIAQFRELTSNGFQTNVEGINVYTMHTGELWNRLTIPGYGRDDANSVIYIDDAYFASGPGARARVEIGNKSTYSTCSNLAIITPTSWSNNSITATFRQGSFAPGSSAYLFVIDSTGAASSGYPITIGGSGGGTPPPPPPACTTTLNTSSASFDSLAHTGSITVTASSSTCSWTATSNASWITTTSGSSGTGSGTVQYSVAQNTSTSQRTGTMTVAGATFTILQSAGGIAACTFTVTPGSVSLSSLAQTGSISVSSSTSSCTWSAVSNSDWITISSGSSGTRTGSGTVQYSVAQNTSTSLRSGTITVAGKTFTVQQAAGTGASCAFSLNTNMATFDYLAQTGTINLTSSTSSCPWTAESNAAWITVTSGSSGTGSGTVVYSIAVNTSSTQRSGTITVGGITYTVYQAAYGHKKPHPPRNLRTAN